MKTQSILVFILLLFCQYATVWSQKWQLVKSSTETIFVPHSRILITKDTVYFAEKDTNVNLKRHTKYKLRKNPYAKTELLYDSLRVKSDRNKITTELYRLFFKQAPIEVHDTSDFDKGEETFKKYEGLIINHIRLRQVDVIEGSVHDTLLLSQSTLVKGANKIHINTARKTIYNSLTINEGDIIKPDVLADNERIIRGLRYIEDARIHVVPSSIDKTKADILIITKDEFSIGVGVDFNGFDNTKVNLNESNFLGIGHGMQHSYIYHDAEQPKHGYGFSYRVNNISKSFISANIEYENSWEKNLKLISLRKGFITPETKYAGGLSLYEISDTRSQTTQDTAFLVNYEAVIKDFWVGRAFQLSNMERTRIRIALRYANVNFSNRPIADTKSNYFYRDRDLILGEFSLVNRKFYKSSLVQGFGVTEDIPYGYGIDLKFGLDKNEFTCRPYFGGGIMLAKHFKYPGFIMAQISAGSFYRNGYVEDAVVKFEYSNIGNLHKINRYSIRNYLNLNYQYGINLTDPDQKTELNNTWTKIASGLNKDGLKGNQKLSASFESTLFTPWYLWGFKFAMFSYGTVGWITNNSYMLKGKSMLASAGIGFRLKNESWVFETLTVGFAYFFKAPDGSNPVGLILDISDPRLFDNFYSDKPNIVEMDRTPRLFID